MGYEKIISQKGGQMKKIKHKEIHIDSAIVDIIKVPNGSSKLIIEQVDDENHHTEIYINHYRIQDWTKKPIDGELLSSNYERIIG